MPVATNFGGNTTTIQQRSIETYAKSLMEYLNPTYNSIVQLQKETNEKAMDEQCTGKGNEFQVGDHVLVRRVHRPQVKRYRSDKAQEAADERDAAPQGDFYEPDAAPEDHFYGPYESSRLTPLVYPGVYRITRMYSTNAAELENAVEPRAPLPWISQFTTAAAAANLRRRDVAHLIKVEAPNIPRSTKFHPWRIELVREDGTVRRGLAKSIRIDGSVGVK